MMPPVVPGQMMYRSLLISTLLKHAAKHHGDVELVSRRVEGDIFRYTYRDLIKRARKLAKGLETLGIAQGDRVATLAWNTYRHMEIYFASSGMGAVCHTVNPRLFPQQVSYIINHSEDQIVFFDLTFLSLVEQLAPVCPSVKTWVCMTDNLHMPQSKVPLICYRDMIRVQDDRYEWPEFDENAAASLCYTSGTTGNPKGALYSHRSTLLHTCAIVAPDAFCLSSADVIMPVVPMYHVNAWGLPYAAAMVGAKLVLPGAQLDGASLYELFESEKVTFSGGVPTLWQGLLNYVKKNGLRFSTFKRTVIGGSACPPAMIRTLEDDYGIDVIHAWGMTELSPVGTVSRLKGKHDSLSPERKRDLLAKQGRVPFGIDMKIVDDEGRDLQWDGKAYGDLMVRGHWVVERYFKSGQSALEDGWFHTGDVATIDADGFMQITDRSKDVIKSGGEWISSVEIENVAMEHPAVQEAACIACHHPKWDERPLLVVTRREGMEVTREELFKTFEGRIAKWWMPDDVVFLDEIPHTATGKVQKLLLRDQFKDYKLPTA